MTPSRSVALRIASLFGVIALLMLAFSESKGSLQGFMDLRAALLVFLTPIFLLILFHSDRVPLKWTMNRLRELKIKKSEDLYSDLMDETETAVGPYGSSHLVRMTENYPDSFLRYCGEIFSSRFPSEQLADLLAKRIESEDRQWQTLYNTFGFLAKMAPYFGMLATVIGMIRLLEHMNDFSKISGSMALAMQGTLYGLISFTMVYSPIQKFFMGCRDQAYARNEHIARWFLLLTQKSDPALIREELRSHRLSMLERKGEIRLAAEKAST